MTKVVGLSNTTKEEMRSEILKSEAILSEVQIALVGRA